MALSRWAERRYRESYSRYEALVDAGIGVSDNFEIVMNRLLRSTDPQGEFFNIPDNEADTLLLEIVSGIKNEFLNNSEHGLEFYLGKRIRHGTLTGHLRGPVENANLITQRTSEIGPYKSNEFWLGKLHFPDPDAGRRLEDAFTGFAAAYDDIIYQLRDVQLHVVSKAHSKGVFDITLSAWAYHWIRGLVQTDLSFEDLLKVCYTIFWGLLEPSLSRARQLLGPEAKEAVARAFDQLQSVARVHTVQNEAYHSLSMMIRDTAAEVQRQLDIVVDWLRRTEVEQLSRRFDLNELLEVALQSALKTHKSFSPVVTRVVRGDVVTSAATLLVVADIVFIIMDNICRRSMSDPNPEVQIACIFDEGAQTLTLEIVNPVGRALDRPVVERQLAKIREQIAKGDIQAGASGERGSGLLKIASMTRQSGRGSTSFGFTDDAYFKTTVTLPVVTQGKTTAVLLEVNQDEYPAC